MYSHASHAHASLLKLLKACFFIIHTPTPYGAIFREREEDIYQLLKKPEPAVGFID